MSVSPSRITAREETLRSTVGREADVPRKRRVSDMGAKYISAYGSLWGVGDPEYQSREPPASQLIADSFHTGVEDFAESEIARLVEIARQSVRTRLRSSM